MSKPSKIAYPGQAKSSADRFGFCYYCSLTEDQKEELFDLVQNGERNVLQRAMLSKAELDDQYVGSYFDTELWVYNYWHESPEDETEHATFRLFDDVSTNPWNYRTYHLYRDGTAKSWAHDKWEAEERPT